MTDKTGGPAFPHVAQRCNTIDGSAEIGPSGMTLRDYFAAKAMATFLTSSTAPGKTTEELLDVVATAAYLSADAMLKAREK